MSTNTTIPDAAEIAEFVRYEPDTGRFYWLPRPPEMFSTKRAFRAWNSQCAGGEALKSLDTHGYHCGIINGKSYRSHRIAWLLHYGSWPKLGIDHINGIRTDNRISNLRDVSKAENNKNLGTRTSNTSGVMGVSWDKNKRKWEASVTVGGKRKHLGRFADFDTAVSARREAERRFGFHQNHGRPLRGVI